MQLCEKSARLAIGLGILLAGVALHEGAGKEPGHEQLRWTVALDNARCSSSTTPGLEPAAMCLDLARQVMVVLVAGLHDVGLAARRDIEDGRAGQPPAVIANHLHVR